MSIQTKNSSLYYKFKKYLQSKDVKHFHIRTTFTQFE